MAKQKTKQPVTYRLFPDNPRVISEDEFLRLQESLGDFGSLDGIVVNTSPGKYFKAIISGNQKAAIIGLENLVPKVSEQFETPTKSGTVCYGFVEYMGEHFPYREVYWSEEKCEVGNIRANNYGGHNDPNMLAAFGDAVLRAAGIDLEYENKAFELLKDFGVVFSQESDDETDEEKDLNQDIQVPQKTEIKFGDLIEIGNHRLLCGDSRVEEYQDKLFINPPTVVFTDPPYGVSIGKKNTMLNSFQPSGRNLTDIEDDDLKPEELKQSLKDSFTILKSKIADDCSVFVTAPQGGELGMMMMMMMKESGLPVRHVLNWVKNSPTFSMGRLDYDYKHEPILFTWNKKHKRKKEGTMQTSVWEVNKPMSNKEHPTMKPVELPENAILNHSDEGDVVADIYSGSGTTMIAAQKTNRRGFCMEISPIYCQVTILRMLSNFDGLVVKRNGIDETEKWNSML